MGSSVPQIQAIETPQLRTLPEFRVGDTVRVHYLIREGEKERVQVFQGTVIRKNRGGVGATFTVRKISNGVGVERIFPLHSPRIQQLEVGFHGKVRRSRLYFLREREGKAARLKESSRALRERQKAAAEKKARKKAKAAANAAAAAKKD